mmetsp:Transcript_12060/g.18219  ORF Transcript_12060/g.18219 Transcript_12060/m.18219 type:complete len:578 (-) Transcript_12060:185-1918(-)
MYSKSNSGGFPPIPGAKERSDDADVNPFRLPADDQIFRMREEEKHKKAEEKQRNQHLKVWEKRSEKTVSNTVRMKELLGDESVKGLRDLSKSDAKQKSGAAARRQEKENMAEFIAKKREMFLVQMSLDTKREEIRKLEEKAQMKEEALQRSEQMLEEDAMRFDAFLKENDKKAHDAIKRAEEETKKKQEKTQEIKRLTQQIQALTSEMSKHKEALEDCLRYKAFLDMLTPPEWFEQHKRAEENEREQLRQSRFEKKLKAWEANKRRIIEQHRKEVEAAKKEAKGSKNKKRQHAEETHDENESDSPRLNIPPPPRLADEPMPEWEEREVPMYFKQPQQLMDIFAALEEQNLFLIQNSQETEHTLEELRLAFRETKGTMSSQTEALQSQIDELQNEIQMEERRAKDLLTKRITAADGMEKAAASSGKHAAGNGNTSGAPHTQQEKEKLLSDLHAKVRYVYEHCGFDASSKPSTLFMLSQLESKLEVLLAEVEQMPTEYVVKAEKDKEKKRRERKREEQQALQEKLQEERNKRSIERSLQAPKKRTGRQVMFRSKPIRKEKKSQGEDNSNDDNDELRFLS